MTAPKFVLLPSEPTEEAKTAFFKVYHPSGHTPFEEADFLAAYRAMTQAAPASGKVTREMIEAARDSVITGTAAGVWIVTGSVTDLVHVVARAFGLSIEGDEPS